MKRKCYYFSSLFILIAILCTTVFASEATYEYISEKHGIEITLPSDLSEIILIEENEEGLSFIHLPSVDGNWKGQMFSIRVKSPKSEYFTSEYSDYNSKIIAVGENRVYVRVTVIGGVDSGEEQLDAYLDTISRLDADYLAKHIVIDGAKTIPAPDGEIISSLVTELSSTEEYGTINRGELSIMMYEMIGSPANDQDITCPFSDVDEGDCEYAAVTYLASWGILNGYPDGSFKAEQKVTRAEFSKVLHMSLFIPYPSWYGDGISVSDVSEAHWAWDYLNCAFQAGWLRESDDRLNPDEPITIGEIRNALSCVLSK